MDVNKKQNMLTLGVKAHYENKKRDRNLKLAGKSGIVNHHFGLGDFDRVKFPTKLSQGIITKIINKLEINQTDELLKQMGPVEPTDKVLDAGSGRGGTAFTLVERFDCTVEGITISPYQARFSNNLTKKFWNTPKARFQVMNMLDLKYKKNYFDHILTNETTMYMTDLTKLFRGFARILKLKGRYTLATWCINEKKRDQSLINKINKHYDASIQTRQQYLEALAKAKFKIITNNDETKNALPYWEIRSLWRDASGIESAYLDGYRKGKLFYLILSSENTVN